MASAFDQYDKSYEKVVQDSISFSGLKHDFFLEAKVWRLADLFQRHFGERRPRLADIGCGIGAMHRMLAPICASIAGSDPSADCIAQAKCANPSVEYTQAEGQALPWADNSFDVALAVCVFHHIAPGARPALIADMGRVVRAGGLVVIIEHNPWNPLTRLAVARCPFDHDAVLLDWREAQTLLASGGIVKPGSEHFLLLPLAAGSAVAIERSLRGLPFGAQYMTAGTVR